MSQQEFFSEEQNQQPLESEIQAQPYYWSTRPKPKTGDAPKNEHPSTYEESILPYGGYRTQGTASYSSHQENSAYRANARQQRAAFESDAFEQSYGPYTAHSMQWQVPLWARPQPNNGKGLRTAVFIVLGLLLIGPILKIMFFLLAGIGILLGVAVFAIVLIPIMLAFLAVFAAVALMGLALFGIRPWHFRRRGFRPWRRGLQGW